mgnify:CR=1 FL=1
MPNIGLRIRELRQQRGQTLEQVAAETGLSVSFISMLERDKVSISVDNLEKLANYFQVHMVHFFRNEAASPVQVTRRDEIVKSLALTSKGPATVTLLSNRPDARMEPLLVAIAPGKEEPHFREHEADVLLYVLEGDATLDVGEGRAVEVEAQCLRGAKPGVREPDKARPRVDVALNEPGRGHAVHKGVPAGYPDPALVVFLAPGTCRFRPFRLRGSGERRESLFESFQPVLNVVDRLQRSVVYCS